MKRIKKPDYALCTGGHTEQLLNSFGPMTPTLLRAGENVLVLNHVGEALSFTHWLRAVGMVNCGRAISLETSGRVIRSHEGCWEVPVPLVVMLAGGKYVRPQHRVRLTRKSLFLRDAYECQYCGQRPGGALLTMDHVIPRAKGGVTRWDNVVTACRHCNQKKGSRTPKAAGLKLRGMPQHPNNLLQLHQRVAMQHTDPAFEVWARYLPAAHRRH